MCLSLCTTEEFLHLNIKKSHLQCSRCALLLPACLADPSFSLPVLAAILTCLTCLGTWTPWCSVEGYFHIIFGNPPRELQRITKPCCLHCLLVAGEVGRAMHLSSHRVAKDIIVLPPIAVYIRRQLWWAVPAKQRGACSLAPALGVLTGKVWAGHFLNYLDHLEAPLQGCCLRGVKGWSAGEDLKILIKFKLL